MKTLTYGTLPTREEFDAAFERECPEGTFKIECRCDRVAAEFCGSAGVHRFTASGMWERIGVALANDAAWAEESGDNVVSFASDVLGVLGFEWV